MGFPSPPRKRRWSRLCSAAQRRLLEVCGYDSPVTVKGVEQMPVDGTSMAYTFAPEASDPDAVPTRKPCQYFEMLGHRGIWADGWKAVTYHEQGTSLDEDTWELYHLDVDYSECHDLAEQQPEKLAEILIPMGAVSPGMSNMVAPGTMAGMSGTNAAPSTMASGGGSGMSGMGGAPSGGAQIPLGQVAEIRIVEGPMAIKTEQAFPTAWVFVDTDASDLGAYVASAQEIRAPLSRSLNNPPGPPPKASVT